MTGALVIRRPLTVATAGDGPPCGVSGAGCAVLIADPALQVRMGFLQVTDTEGVRLERLVLDGNRSARLASAAAVACHGAGGAHSPDTRYGYNASVHRCRGCSFIGGISRNALCGTSLEWSGTEAFIAASRFEGNGDSSLTMMWADGLTLHDADRADVRDNVFVDNTDVHLVWGGGRDGSVRNNHVLQRHGVAFAGINLDNFDGTTPGDFTGSMVRDNTIDGGPALGCHFGINIGPHAWYVSSNTRGGTVTANVIRNVRQGINVDGAGTAEAPVVLHGNDLPAVPDHGEFCERRATSPLNINTADSVVDRRGDEAPFTDREWHRCP